MVYFNQVVIFNLEKLHQSCLSAKNCHLSSVHLRQALKAWETPSTLTLKSHSFCKNKHVRVFWPEWLVFLVMNTVCGEKCRTHQLYRNSEYEFCNIKGDSTHRWQTESRGGLQVCFSCAFLTCFFLDINCRHHWDCVSVLKSVFYTLTTWFWWNHLHFLVDWPSQTPKKVFWWFTVFWALLTNTLKLGIDLIILLNAAYDLKLYVLVCMFCLCSYICNVYLYLFVKLIGQ